MSAIDNLTGRKIKNQGEQAARKAASSPLLERMIRLGYAVRGIVYGVIGILALQVAFGRHGQIVNQQGAIQTIGAQPFGHFLLYLILVGLAGYSLWGFIRAIFDPLHKGNDLKGLAARAGYLFSAISYGLLVYPTYQAIKGSAAISSGNSGAQHTTGTILTKPWGPPLIAIIGLIVVAAGLSQVYHAYKRDFDLQFKSYALPPEGKKWATRLGVFGTAARGIVFAIAGVLLIQAGLYTDPSRVKGIDGALAILASQPYGPWLLAVVAAGLIAFGIYSIVGALYFRLQKV